MNWFWDRKRKAYEGIGLNILVEMGFERRVACACELHGPLSFNGGFSIFVLGLWAFHKFYKSCFGPQNIDLKSNSSQVNIFGWWFFFFFGNKEISLNFFKKILFFLNNISCNHMGFKIEAISRLKAKKGYLSKIDPFFSKNYIL